jgi:diaminopimelate decarboxylase
VDHFQRQGPTLHCEDVNLHQVAERFGTPTYVYSKATITRHIKVLQEALVGLPHHICYAVKANANLAILEVIQELGCGFDAVSVGELKRVEHIGADPKQVIFSGVGKRDDEIRSALEAGVLYICVESEEELSAVSSIAQSMGISAPVSVRVNPDVDPKTHPYIATGLNKNKFGIPMDRAESIYKEALDNPNLKMVGVTCHIGSQVTQLDPFLDAAHRMLKLTQALLAQGSPLEYMGMGGGLGIPYAGETPPPPREYGEALASILGELGLTIVFEPGRVIIGNAGVLLTEVVRRKEGATRTFTIVDAGMNDLIRPALYQAHHGIEGVDEVEGPTALCDVVGPVCESADTFADQEQFPVWKPGSLLAIRSCGAYGFVMACQYNGRPRPAEVLCDGGHAYLIRERETLEQLWTGEIRLDVATSSGEK